MYFLLAVGVLLNFADVMQKKCSFVYNELCIYDSLLDFGQRETLGLASGLRRKHNQQLYSNAMLSLSKNSLHVLLMYEPIIH